MNIGERSGVAREELERMGSVLSHRGPDDAGVYIEAEGGRCGLVHRRLSIIDLAGGHQPMSMEDRALWICYNGECYNYRELRKDLEGKGHRFRTACDTEVVLHLYAEYGEKCVKYIRGMFALVVWDERDGTLFLARDRMGQKPLYYGEHEGRLIFASEIKAILQAEGFPQAVDYESLGHYFLLGYVSAPKTAFRDIRQLPPGHTWKLSPQHTDSRPQRYWELPGEARCGRTFEQACDEVRETLREATRLRMISDVPLGAFLSGGIDSTIIVGLMSGLEERAVNTCSIGFETDLYNELPLAEAVARRYETTHYYEIVKPDCAATVEKLGEIYDEPFADSSALPMYHLAHLARRQVTVALGGDGGDECFGGYDRYRAMLLAETLRKTPLLRQALPWLSRCLGKGGEYRSLLTRVNRFVSAAALPAMERYLRWIAIFSPEMARKIVGDGSGTTVCERLECLPGNTNDIGSGDPAAWAMGFDGRYYLPGDLNTKTDRATMSASLELRSPFQDHKVVELAYSLPRAFRHDSSKGKRILRAAFADLIPPAIAQEPKRGFGVPVGEWFRNELRSALMDTVLSERARQRGVINTAFVEKMAAEHEEREADHGPRLWSLLMLELWFRRYVDG